MLRPEGIRLCVVEGKRPCTLFSLIYIKSSVFLAEIELIGFLVGETLMNHLCHSLAGSPAYPLFHRLGAFISSRARCALCSS